MTNQPFLFFGVCKLCLQQRELCDSHIIPEFMYKPLYDNKHRAIAVSANGTEQEETIQKGYREPLLCKECENRLSVWETHVARVWSKVLEQTSGATAGSFTLRARYFDLKLFYLSLFWRASLSRHPNFGAVDLGAQESAIRDMLWSGTPGPITAYPSFAFAYSGIAMLARTIGIAGAGTMFGVPAFKLPISGIELIFFNTNDLPEAAQNSFLAVSHRGLTIGVSNVPESHEIQRMAQNIFR